MKGNKFSAIQLRALEAAGVDKSLLEGLKKARKNIGMDPDKPSCWKGYKATGTKKKGGKEVPDCKKEEVEISERERVLEGLTGERAARARVMQDTDTKRKGGKRTDADRDTAFRLGTGTGPGRVSDRPIKSQTAQGKGNAAKRRMGEEVELEEQKAKVRQNGNIYIVGFTWLGKYMMMKLFFPEVTKPSRREAEVALQKIYPGARMQRFDQAPYNPSEPMLYMGVQENEEVEYVEEKKDKDTPDQVKAVIAFDKARKGTDDATYDSEHGKKKQRRNRLRKNVTMPSGNVTKDKKMLRSLVIVGSMPRVLPERKKVRRV